MASPMGLVCDIVAGEYIIRWADDESVVSSAGGPVRETSQHLPPVHVGQTISVRLPDEDVPETVALLLPAEEEAGALLEQWEADGFPMQSEDARPVGRFYVNTEEWGWCVLDDSNVLWPIPKVRPDDVFTVTAWMSASMAGAYLTAGVRTYGRVALVWFRDDESNPGGSTAELHYTVDDWDVLLDDSVRALMHDWFEALCPFCEQDDPSGWELELSVSVQFSDEGLGRSLSRIFQPCAAHRDEAEAGRVMRDVADIDWRWDEGHWLPHAPSASTPT